MTKHVAVSCVFFIVAVIPSCSNKTATSETRLHKRPRIRVEPQILDLGRLEISSDATMNGQFALRNEGDGPLVILGRDVSCGCTIPDWPPATINPESEVIVKLSVRAKNEAGMHSSSVTFKTNDPATPTVQVVVRWTETSAIACEPQSIDFGPIDPAVDHSRSVLVTLSEKVLSNELQVASNSTVVNAKWSDEEFSEIPQKHKGSNILRITLSKDRELGSGLPRCEFQTRRRTCTPICQSHGIHTPMSK